MVPAGVTNNDKAVSNAARQFAIARYPFSPFTVVFSQEAREKAVVEDLIRDAADNWNFELKTIACRRGRLENNEHHTLIFVENSDSSIFLHDQRNQPNTLADRQFTIRRPSIQPQLALVIPFVSLQIDWDDFVQELKEKSPDIGNIIRLKNKARQPVLAVKLEFLSSKQRDEILLAGEISITHMKLKVVEYHAQANVLICSNCYESGHFRKNCTQKNESTCKICREKYVKLKAHLCSGVLKCLHCRGSLCVERCQMPSGERLSCCAHLEPSSQCYI